jgi:hypothetical protein
MTRIQELESTIKLSEQVLNNDKAELEALIYQEIKSDMEQEFLGWWDMDDAKEVCHGYIIKALNHYDINEDTMLKLEGKLIDFCIDMGVK